MDCACVYVDCNDTYDDGGSENLVAGIERKCCECSRSIDLGETYEFSFGIHRDYDDNVEEMDEYTTCLDCVSIRDSFFCHGWAYNEIWNDLEEHLAEVVLYGDGVSSSCLVPLTKNARDKVCDLIEKLWSEQEDNNG